MDTQTIVAIACVFLGWLLGQGGEILRIKIEERRLAKALDSEIEDIGSWLERMERSVIHDFQLVVLDQQLDSVPSPLYTAAFRKHYLEISGKIDWEKRLLCVNTLSLTEIINSTLHKLESMLLNQNEIDKDIYTSLLFIIYQNIRIARFTITNFHHKKLSIRHPFVNQATREYEATIEPDFLKAKEEAEEKGLKAIENEYWADSNQESSTNTTV